MKTLILLLLLPAMSFGQMDTTKFYLSSDTTKKFLISEFAEMPYFYVNHDTARGNHLIVRNDTTFEIWGDTMEVIKMLWINSLGYMHDAEMLQLNYTDLEIEYKQHLREDKRRFDSILKQLKATK